MSVPIECPKCQHLFYVPDEYVGKKGKCPKCAHLFRAEAQDVATFPSVEEEELPVMPVVAGGSKKAPPIPPPVGDSADDIPTFVTLAPKSKPPAGKEKVIISVPEPAAEKKASPPKSEEKKPADSAEIPSFVVLPKGEKGSASKAPLPKAPALHDSGPMVAVSPADKAKLPKGAAKSTGGNSANLEVPDLHAAKPSLPKGAAKSPSGSSANLDLPAIDIGAAPKPGSGVRPGAGPAAAAPQAAPAKDGINWVPIGLIGGGVVVVVIGLIVWSQMGGSKPPVAGPNAPGTEKKGAAETATGNNKKLATTTPAVNPVTARVPDVKAIAGAVALSGPSVVRIEAVRKGSKIEGLGTVVDDRGWIATSYELVSGADQVTVHFQGGMKEESQGTVAVDSQHGLAVIAVEDMPAGIVKRPVAGASTISATQILFPAVNESGQGPLRDTMVIKFEKFRELPFTVQKSLGGDLRRDEDMSWIKHDTPVAANGIGGALFDGQGTVVGIRIPLSGSEGNGYAIPAKFLSSLVSKASGEITPFDPTKIAATPTTPMPLEPPPGVPEVKPMPEPEPMPPAGDEGRRTAQLARLAELIKIGDGRRFAADSAEQYAELREIADLLVDISIEIDREGLPEAEKSRLETGRDAAIESLGDFLWPAEIGETSKQALESLRSSPGKGAFLYIEFLGSQDQFGFAKIMGTEELVVIPGTKNIGSLQAGTQYLVPGRHDASVMRSVGVNGGAPKVAFTILAKQLISRPIP